MSQVNDRKKKLLYNSITGFIFQIITVLYGLIMPSYYINYYGSNTNGLVSSITQFLGLIAFCECGVGAIVQTALYKPLSEKNEEELSGILFEAGRFFRRIALVLVLYVCALVFTYPLLVNDDFDFFTTSSLFLILSVSSFSQYYFGICNQLLVGSDQRVYVQYICQIIITIATGVGSIVLIRIGCSIQIVKLYAATIQFIRPAYLSYYVKKHYNIKKPDNCTNKYLQQKWNGVIHHISYVIVEHTDVVVLTVFSNLINVSIYYIYSMVVTGIRAVIDSISAGFQSMLGNIFHTESEERIKKEFTRIEWLIHSITTIAFSDVLILIIPFISIYTRNVTDANYIQPCFGILLTFAHFSYCIRLPYHYMIRVAGHYKETQKCAIIEASINVVVSIVLVNMFGLVGVAIGTICAMMFRTFYLVNYLRKKILKREITFFVKQLLSDLITIFLSTFLSSIVLNTHPTTYLKWTLLAIESSIIVLIVFGCVNVCFHKKQLICLFKKYY